MSESASTAGLYRPVARILHWATALVVLGLLSVGFGMVILEPGPLKLDLYWWHKSFGLLALGLVAVRLFWRFRYKPPPPLPTHRQWEKALAKLIHVFFYAALLALPLSGWVMSSAAEFPVSFFGLAVPPLTGKSEPLFGAMRQTHELLALLVTAAVFLHFSGALKHHFIDRDPTLRRMTRESLGRTGALILTGFFALFLAVPVGLYGVLLLRQPSLPETEESIVTVAAPGRAGEAPGTVAPRWTVLDGAALGFSATQYGRKFTGTFPHFDAVIDFAPDNLPESRVAVTIDMHAVETGSPERDRYIRDKAWLAAGSYPEARFVADDFEKTAGNSYLARAALTIRGVTKLVELPFTLKIEMGKDGKTLAAVDGELAINRLDFGIGTGQWADPSVVGETVTIRVNLRAECAGAPESCTF